MAVTPQFRKWLFTDIGTAALRPTQTDKMRGRRGRRRLSLAFSAAQVRLPSRPSKLALVPVRCGFRASASRNTLIAWSVWPRRMLMRPRPESAPKVAWLQRQRPLHVADRGLVVAHQVVQRQSAPADTLDKWYGVFIIRAVSKLNLPNLTQIPPIAAEKPAGFVYDTLVTSVYAANSAGIVYIALIISLTVEN